MMGESRYIFSPEYSVVTSPAWNRACFVILLAERAAMKAYNSVSVWPCSLTKLYQPYSAGDVPSLSSTFSPDNIFSSLSSIISRIKSFMFSEEMSISFSWQCAENSLTKRSHMVLKSVSSKQYFFSSSTTTLYLPRSSIKHFFCTPTPKICLTNGSGSSILYRSLNLSDIALSSTMDKCSSEIIFAIKEKYVSRILFPKYPALYAAYSFVMSFISSHLISTAHITAISVQSY